MAGSECSRTSGLGSTQLNKQILLDAHMLLLMQLMSVDFTEFDSLLSLSTFLATVLMSWLLRLLKLLEMNSLRCVVPVLNTACSEPASSTKFNSL